MTVKNPNTPEGRAEELEIRNVQNAANLKKEMDERLRAEEVLRANAERLRDFMRAGTDWQWETDAEGRLSYVSERFVDIAGVATGELMGKTIKEIWDRHITAHADSPWSRLVDRFKNPTEFRNLLFDWHRPDGEVRTFRFSGLPIYDRDGTFQGFRGAGQDATEQQRTERALRESEERYALAIRGANEAIWDWDLRSGQVYAPRLGELLGYRPGEHTPHPVDWRARVHPANLEKYLTWFRKHLKGETPFYSVEYQVRNKDGRYIWIHDSGIALRDESGRVFRMAGSVGDVTARRLAEDRLRQSQKMEALGQLAGGIAHEFNNLLVGIGGFAAMAQGRIDDPTRVRFCLAEVTKAADRAAHLTRDLLTFSRKRAAQPTLLRVTLGEVIEDVSHLLKTLIGTKVEMNLLVDNADAVIEVDPSQLAQVITNLAINARDAMPNGGRLTIGTQCIDIDAAAAALQTGARSGRYAAIHVADTGSGIDAETMKHLFEPFFTTKEPGKGTGLGLSMVWGTVEQAGGFIAVDSIVGEGSTFTVHIPLSERPAESATPSATPAPIVDRPATILLVEDDPTVRMLACQTLMDRGHQVWSASGGQEALSMMAAHEAPFDLLLTDVVMPDLDGAELARRAVDVQPGLPVLFTSAYPGGEAILDEGWPSLARFLPKPFTPDRLASDVRDILHQARHSGKA